MGMTMTQKILALHAPGQDVQAGSLVECRIDLALANDITAPLAIQEFGKLGVEHVFDRTKIALVPDHFTPNKDIASAQQAKTVREFAQKEGIQWYFEVGRMGIEHALLPEAGLVKPGDLIIGADSHTCTYGALGAFSTGVGSTDMGCAMATGSVWLRVPEAIRFVLTGKPGPYVSGKDVILHIIGMIGVDGARYTSMEFTGDGLRYLSMADRFTMANMAVEGGAKNGIFPVDDAAQAYAKEHAGDIGTILEPDADAVYRETIEIDLSQVPLTVAYPHLPENARSIQEAMAEDIAIDQVVVGSCTNGRIEDLRVAASILRGRKVHPRVRMIVIPATQKIYKQAMQEGLTEVFIDAGAVFSTPTCGPCLGGYMGVLAAGERCVATTNRNFLGRMGHKDSQVYLAGPAVAAASAVAGRIASPQSILQEV